LVNGIDLLKTSMAITREKLLYDQLAGSLNRLSRSISTTADLAELLQADLHAIRIFATLDAAKLMTVASELIAEPEESETKVSQ
jgi:hypothetical protein